MSKQLGIIIDYNWYKRDIDQPAAGNYQFPEKCYMPRPSMGGATLSPNNFNFCTFTIAGKCKLINNVNNNKYQQL